MLVRLWSGNLLQTSRFRRQLPKQVSSGGRPWTSCWMWVKLGARTGLLAGPNRSTCLVDGVCEVLQGGCLAVAGAGPLCRSLVSQALLWEALGVCLNQRQQTVSIISIPFDLPDCCPHQSRTAAGWCYFCVAQWSTCPNL